MLTRFIKQSWLVLVSALVFGLLVAAVHGTLDERIKRNAREKLERALRTLLTEAATFSPVTAEVADGRKVGYYVGEDPAAAVAGYALEVAGSGFADEIRLLVAFDVQQQNYLGIAVLKSNETPGFGAKIKEEQFKGQFRNCPAEQRLLVIKTGDRSIADERIVAITGATISSEAVVKIVNDAKTDMIAALRSENIKEESLPEK